MKKIHTTGILLLLIGLIAQPLNTKAQDFGELLKGTAADANTLLEGYIAPAMNGIGNGLNQGWYNTAKPHKTLGVDFTITTSLMYVPSSDETYTVDNNELESIKLVSLDGQPVSSTAVTEVPTIFGPAKTPQYQVGSFQPFDGPEGLDLKNTIKIANALPVPIYHLGVGIPKGFDLKLRWSPTVNLGDIKFSLFGIGVMHDIKQYIKGVKALPFDLSAFVGYTNMKYEQGGIVGDGSASVDAKGIAKFNSTTIQVLISKKISVLTFYGGAGFNIAKSSLDLTGTYDLDGDGNATDKNPVALDFSTSGFRTTGGMRLKLAVFTFNGDFTWSKYSAFSFGFGINVR